LHKVTEAEAKILALRPFWPGGLNISGQSYDNSWSQDNITTFGQFTEHLMNLTIAFEMSYDNVTTGTKSKCYDNYDTFDMSYDVKSSNIKY